MRIRVCDSVPIPEDGELIDVVPIGHRGSSPDAYIGKDVQRGAIDWLHTFLVDYWELLTDAGVG